MAPKQFKTHLRLWFWISLTLNILAWFMPFWTIFGNRAADIWLTIFGRGLIFDTETAVALMAIGLLQLLFGLSAICIGWVLQCLIVMVKGARKTGP